MDYFKSTLRLILIILIILNLASYLPSQKKIYKGFNKEDSIKTWKKWVKKFPLPKDAVELEVIQSFPSEDLVEKGIYLWRPLGVEGLSNGNIVVNDQKTCQILMFDNQGNFIKKIGEKGQGPGEFGNPYCLSATSETIIVGDNSNMRIQFFDINGNYMRTFKIFKAYIDIAVSEEGLIYAAPLRSKPESPLVDVMDKNGKLLYSFREARFGDKSRWQIPNWIRISLNDKNEVFIAFRYFPLVCKYSENGDLLAEYKLEHEVMKEEEKINLDRIKKNSESGMIPVIISIRASSDGFYILHNYPRTEILEYDNDGRLQNEYYYEYKNRAHDTYFGDFFIKKIEGKKLFYLLKKVPENEIIILRPKKISSYKERR